MKQFKKQYYLYLATGEVIEAYDRLDAFIYFLIDGLKLGYEVTYKEVITIEEYYNRLEALNAYDNMKYQENTIITIENTTQEEFENLVVDRFLPQYEENTIITIENTTQEEFENLFLDMLVLSEQISLQEYFYLTQLEEEEE